MKIFGSASKMNRLPLIEQTLRTTLAGPKARTSPRARMKATTSTTPRAPRTPKTQTPTTRKKRTKERATYSSSGRRPVYNTKVSTMVPTSSAMILHGTRKWIRAGPKTTASVSFKATLREEQLKKLSKKAALCSCWGQSNSPEFSPLPHQGPGRKEALWLLMSSQLT